MHNFIEWETLKFKKNSGKEKLRCTACDSSRSDKKDKSLQINHNDGFGKCHYCEALTFKEDGQEKKETDYKLPIQTWKNYTNLSDNMVKYLEGRKISQATAISLNWTEEQYYQPKLGKNVNNLVFNYFEGETLVNKKYRDSQKNFTQSSGTKSIFYNINSVINAKRVYIVEGECFDKDASIFTNSGWKLFKDITYTDLVAQYDNGCLEFVKPLNYVKKKFTGDLIKYTNSRNNFYSLTTPNHNLLTTKGKVKAKDVCSSQLNIIRNGEMNSKGIDYTDNEIRLLIAISADFTIRDKGDIYGAFKKQRKRDRLVYLLDILNVRYSLNIDSRGYYSFFIHRNHDLRAFKEFPMVWLTDMNLSQRNVFIEEVVFWDGNKVPNRTMTEFSSKLIYNAEFVQTMCHTVGMCSTIVKRKNKFGKWFKVTMLQKKTSTISKKYQSKEFYNDFVYCVTVPNGAIMVKQNNIITISGNCDVASIYELNKKDGIISLPNGANDSDEFWKQSEKYLKNVESFIIGTDSDEKGQEVKEKIAQRLGRHKCTYLDFVGKDANEDLISGDLANTLKNEKRFPVSGTFTAKDLRDGVNDLYDNGLPDTIFPKHQSFGNLKDIFSVMRGQLILPTGIPSHGKSTFTDWYVLNLIKDYDMKCSWYTPEHTPMHLYETELIQKTIGRNFWKDKDGQKRISKDEIDKYDEWANEKIYLTDCSEDEVPTWDWLLNKFKEQMFNFGIDIFVIDAFNKVILPKGNKIEEINTVLTRLTHFARSNNVIIFLIAHPTKMKKNEAGVYDAPTLYDVSGSSDFRNQVHCGYTIYRHFGDQTHTEFINLKTKYSFQGTIGGVERFEFCPVNGRLVSESCADPYFNLIDNTSLRNLNEPIKIPNIQPNEAFLLDDNEVPF